MDELPDFYMPYFDCNTGPYWSNGKWQSSTSQRDCKPKSKLDVFSGDHDTAYATCGDYDCLTGADDKYYHSTRNLNFAARAIGVLPKYGNAIPRAIMKKLGYQFKGAEHGENMNIINNRGNPGNLRGIGNHIPSKYDPYVDTSDGVCDPGSAGPVVNPGDGYVHVASGNTAGVIKYDPFGVVHDKPTPQNKLEPIQRTDGSSPSARDTVSAHSGRPNRLKPLYKRKKKKNNKIYIN